MEYTIFYYTGTGNSLWVARTIAGLLGNSELISISEWMKDRKPVDSEVIGIVFPVHMWGVPPPVVKFIAELKTASPKYMFGLAVNAGQVANTLVQLKDIFRKNAMSLCSGYEIQLPTNYIPWGSAESREVQEKKFEAAVKKIPGIVATIKNREKKPVEKGQPWQRWLLTLIYKLSYSRIPKMDARFMVDEKCNHCGICSRICPAGNIVMADGRPTWNHHCEQCLACIQWCPEKAIQYGEKTAAYERYHHPEITLKDMLIGADRK